jgi:UDP-glucose 4-epimerase
MPNIERVLITGGCGFIGANLVRFLREKQPAWSLRTLDNLIAGETSYLEDGSADVRVGDAAEPSDLDEALDQVDAVIHLASQTGVVPSLEDPDRDFRGNAMTTFRVLEGCRLHGIERLVFASSGAAVGDVDPPIHEKVLPRPLSPYGAGKLVGEAYCQAYAGSFGMQTVSLRFSNVYGPFSQHKKNAIPNFIKRGLDDKPIEIYGDGTQTRDFIHVDDLCDGILRSLTTDGISGEVFQLASGVETSILDVAKITQETTGGNGNILFEPRRAGEVYKSRADIAKAGALLGFQPRVALRDGLVRTTDWYRERWSSAGSG